MKDYIGIFDSGLGGLAVVKCLNKLMPNENIIFFGDNERMPYGTKTRETIRKYAKENTLFLNHFNLKALGIACNTMDANGHDIIEKYAKAPVYGLIETTSKKAIKKSKNKRIGIIATKATVKTKNYSKMLKAFDENAKVYEVASYNLASLIELNASKEKIKKELIKCFKQIKDKDIDTLILGCTHYHFCIKEIKELLPNINIISSSYELALSIKNNLKDKKKTKGNNIYYVSKYYEEYSELIQKLLNKKDKIKVTEINLKEYL